MRIPDPGGPEHPEAASPSGPEPRHTIDITNAWQPPDAAATGCWSRSFGLPSGLGPGDRVWLVIDEGRDCRLALNDAALAMARSPGGRTAEVTGLLAARNRLLLLPAAGERPLPPDTPSDDPVGGLRPNTGGLRPNAGGLRGTHGRCPLPAAYGSVRLEIEDHPAGRRPDETSAGA